MTPGLDRGGGDRRIGTEVERRNDGVAALQHPRRPAWLRASISVRRDARLTVDPLERLLADVTDDHLVVAGLRQQLRDHAPDLSGAEQQYAVHDDLGCYAGRRVGA